MKINKFNESFDNITINSDFNKIKHQLNYRFKIDEKPKKKLVPLFISLALAILLIPSLALLIPRINNKQDLNYQDFLNYQVVFKTTDDLKIEDHSINIALPMMYNACNLEKQIISNTTWEVYKDGIKQDKENLPLSFGENSFDVVVYKLNQVNASYNLNINVGK